MKRRQFITFFAGAAVWPVTASGQRAAPVIGLLSGGSARGYGAGIVAFLSSLREAGFFEGQNLTIEYRWAEGRNDRLPILVADLIRRKVDVIVVAGGTATALAARTASATIPIVFAIGGDPVKAGLIASVARPGGNMTGVTNFSDALLSKRLELLRELVPDANVIAVLLNPSNPNTQTRSTEVTAAALSVRQNIRILDASSEDQFEGVFATLVQERIRALVVQNDTLFNEWSERLGELAAKNAVPTIYEYRESVAAGGLISYGGSQRDSYRQVGIYVSRILKGESPADLPVVRPTKFDLVINLKAARALGLEVPAILLAGADEVLE
jgi:putative ABC transport system substrate-binding protein